MPSAWHVESPDAFQTSPAGRAAPVVTIIVVHLKVDSDRWGRREAADARKFPGYITRDYLLSPRAFLENELRLMSKFPMRMERSRL